MRPDAIFAWQASTSKFAINFADEASILSNAAETIGRASPHHKIYYIALALTG